MQIRKVSPGRGLRWLMESADRTGRHLGSLAGVAVVWVLVSLIGFIPVIGGLVMILIGPLLTAGLIAAFHLLEGGRRPGPGTLFEGWRRQGARGSLLVLGGFVLLGVILAVLAVAVLLAGQIPMEEMQRLSQLQAGDPVDLPENLTLWPALAAVLVIMIGVVAGIYFAVPLVLLEGTGAGRALATSWKACLRNLPAMVVMALCILGIGLAAALMLVVVGMIVSIALPANIAGIIMQIPALLLGVTIQLVFAGGQYRAWLDVFADESGRPAPDIDDDDGGHLTA